MQFITKNKPPSDVSLTEQSVQESSSEKFLGVTLDNRLTWLPYTTSPCSSISKVSFA